MTKPLIAVVDDDPSVVRSLVRRLRLAGYCVTGFGSAQEFLSSLNRAAPRCLVVDVQMPDVNGFQLDSRLRALGCRMPVIFITAHDTPQTRASAKGCEAAALLFKPFDTAELLRAIKEGLSPRGQRQAG